MLRLTALEIENYVNQRLSDVHGTNKDDHLEFVCAPHKDKWCLTINDNLSKVSIRMRSAREDVRKFASIDSAYKSIMHLTNYMIVIGK